MSETIQVMEGQTSFDGTEDNKTKDDNNSIETMLNDAAENAATQSEEENHEHLKAVGKRTHESHIGEWTVASILKAWSQKKIILPLCQRLFVWKKEQQKLLLDSIERGLKCGSFELATWEGHGDTQYLCDGLQRLISLMLMSNDSKLSKEQHKLILDYKISMEVVYELNDEEMAMWFLRLNSGVAVSSATKERSKLPTNLNNAILQVSSNQFFNDISKRANATFSKNSQNDVISESALLACAGVKLTDIKSKTLCGDIQTYEADVLQNITKANEIVNRLANIYKQITDEKIAKRSLNANFLAVLVHVMVENNFTDEQIVDLINYIFAGRSATKEYRETTGGYSANDTNCEKRYKIIVKLLSNPVKGNDTNDVAYHDFCRANKGKVINTRDNDHPVGFEDFTEDERKQLYVFCEVEKNMNKFEGVVMKTFNRVAKETEKESA